MDHRVLPGEKSLPEHAEQTVNDEPECHDQQDRRIHRFRREGPLRVENAKTETAIGIQHLGSDDEQERE